MIFELFTEHQFDVGEISKIQNRTVQEIEQLLEAARKSIKISLYNRFINE